MRFTLKVNRWFNHARARLGLPYWSLSRYLKQKVKRAVSYVGEFEVAVAREAHRRGADGVVCGHIHHAEMRMVDGVLYCNDGDWVESLTALVEHPRWAAGNHRPQSVGARAARRGGSDAHLRATPPTRRRRSPPEPAPVLGTRLPEVSTRLASR